LAALAMKGRERVPIAARPIDPRSTERLLSLLMSSSLLFSSAARILGAATRLATQPFAFLRFRRRDCSAILGFAVFEFVMIGDRRKNGLKRLPACGTIAAHLLRRPRHVSLPSSFCYSTRSPFGREVDGVSCSKAADEVRSAAWSSTFAPLSLCNRSTW